MVNQSRVVEGVQFPNPIIIASCPLTENISNIMRCVNEGAGGIILKTAAAYQRLTEAGQRKILQGKNGYWAQSTFEREIMTLEEMTGLIKETKKYTNIPVIASIASEGLSSDKWVSACGQAERAGAEMVQLDFFYMPDLVSLENAEIKLTQLIMQIRNEIHIPIIPKININLPAGFIFPILRKSGIQVVSLLDSIRVPLVKEWIETQDWKKNALTNEGTSFFGSWQLPLSLHFLMEARKYGLIVIGGGGIRSTEDVAIMLHLGADLIQIASMAMFGRWSEISNIKQSLLMK